MAVLKIGSGSSATDLPTPSTMKISLQDVDSSTTTRNVLGYMIRDRVRGGSGVVRKIECTWKGIPIKTAALIHNLVADTYFQLTYPDTYTGTLRTGTFYVGDRSADVLSIDPDGENAVLSTVSMNFIEK